MPAVQFVFTQSMLGLICVWKNFLVCFIILRCYEVASVHSLPQCVSGCWELLHSEAFFLLLSNFTGLRLHFLCPADDDEVATKKPLCLQMDQSHQIQAKRKVVVSFKGVPKQVCTAVLMCPLSVCLCCAELSTPVCCGEVRQWSHGSYTLLHDGEAARAEYALDLVLPFGCKGETTNTHPHKQIENTISINNNNNNV